MTMGHDDFYRAIQQLRELVSGHPLQPLLMDDINNWRTLCDAMDSLQDNQGDSVKEIQSQQDAMNRIRHVLGIDVLDWEDVSGSQAHRAAIQASIEAVNTELGDRANVHYEQFDDQALSSLLDKAAYALNQVEAIVIKQESGQSTEWEQTGLRVLRQQLEDVRRGLVARRLDEPHHLADVDDALFIVKVIKRSLGTLSDDRTREVDLLARAALPALVSRVQALAVDVDNAYGERKMGWRP